MKSYEYVSGSWTQYLPDLTGLSSITRLAPSTDGDIVALSKNNANQVYSKQSVTATAGYTISQPVATFQEPGGSVISNNGLVAVTYDNSSIGEVKIFEKDSGGNWPSTASATYTGPSISASTWTQLGSDIDGEALYDFSGAGVSMSSDGTRVAIGATATTATAHPPVTCACMIGTVELLCGPRWAPTSTARLRATSSGTRYLYPRTARAWRSALRRTTAPALTPVTCACTPRCGRDLWTQVGSDIDGEAAGDQSGWSVSMSSDGTRVAIGAPMNDAPASVRVYEESSGTWTQVGSDIDGEAALRLSPGQRCLCPRMARAWRSARNTTAVPPATFGCSMTTVGRGLRWGQTSTARLRTTYSGQSVSMSSDGTRVAIGAYGNDGTGTDAGHVRVYAESGGTWTQVGQDIDGEAAGDQFGRSVSCPRMVRAWR